MKLKSTNTIDFTQQIKKTNISGICLYFGKSWFLFIWRIYD